MSRALRLVAAVAVIATAGLTAAQSPTTPEHSYAAQHHAAGCDADNADDSEHSNHADHSNDAERPRDADDPDGADPVRHGHGRHPADAVRPLHVAEPGRIRRRPHGQLDGGHRHRHLHPRLSLRPGVDADAGLATARRNGERERGRLDAQPCRLPIGRHVGRALPDDRHRGAALHALHAGRAREPAGRGVDLDRAGRVRPTDGRGDCPSSPPPASLPSSFAGGRRSRSVRPRSARHTQGGSVARSQLATARWTLHAAGTRTIFVQSSVLSFHIR